MEETHEQCFAMDDNLERNWRWLRWFVTDFGRRFITLGKWKRGDSLISTATSWERGKPWRPLKRKKKRKQRTVEGLCKLTYRRISCDAFFSGDTRKRRNKKTRTTFQDTEKMRLATVHASLYGAASPCRRSTTPKSLAGLRNAGQLTGALNVRYFAGLFGWYIFLLKNFFSLFRRWRWIQH